MVPASQRAAASFPSGSPLRWPTGNVPAHTGFVEVQIREGRKNQVKRMLGRVHHPVLRLHRCRFGDLDLGDLALGSWRELDEREVALLRG